MIGRPLHFVRRLFGDRRLRGRYHTHWCHAPRWNGLCGCGWSLRRVHFDVQNRSVFVADPERLFPWEDR